MVNFQRLAKLLKHLKRNGKHRLAMEVVINLYEKHGKHQWAELLRVIKHGKT